MLRRRRSSAALDPLPGPFRTLVVAAAATNVADGIRAVALPLLAVALTRDPLLVAGLGVAQTLPGLLVGLPAGVLADRFDRRRLAVMADVVQSLLFALVLGAIVGDLISIPLLYLVAFVLGAAETMADTAMAAAIPALVADRQLERANGRLVSVVFVGQQLLGPAIGATLFAVAAAAVFGISAGLVAVSAALVASLPSFNRTAHRQGDVIPPSGPSTAADLRGRTAAFLADVREGASFLARHPLLGSLTVLAVVLSFTDAAWFGVLVLLLTDELGAPEAAYGIVLAIAAGGGIAGGLTAERVLARVAPGVMLRGGLVLVAGAQMLIGVSRHLVIATIGLAVGNAVLAWWHTAAATLRQSLTPDRVLGRVGATWRTASLGAIPAGMWAGGLIAAGHGVRAPFIWGVPLLLLAALATRRLTSTAIQTARAGTDR